MLSILKEYWIHILVLLLVLAVLGFVTYSFTSPKGRFSGVQNDLKAIEAPVESPYTTLEGEAVELKDFKGKPLIINSWATWAPFAHIEFPLLNNAKNTYGDRVEIISINRKENKNIVRSYIQTFNINPAIVVLLDPTDFFYKNVGGYAMPETLFYDADGTVVFHKRGVLTQNDLDLHIQNIIE